MTKYNDAELHAIKELDPPGFARWQLADLDPDLEWYTWLESQVSPPPGVPFLRCDCVAGFRSRSGDQAPWACLIEAQAQPIPRLGVWVLIYLGLLHEDLRHGPHDRDRFQMMAGVVNLCEAALATNIDWTPPVVAGAGEPMGVKCRFWVRNVRQEDAAGTLEDIAAKKTALCVLPWVPLMAGGDRPEVLERWQEVAKLQDKLYLRADYVAIALVFAELAGREAVWAAALKEFDVNDSRIAQQWEDKGIDRGIVKGTLLGQVHLCQKLLKQPMTPEKDLRSLPNKDLEAMLTQLLSQLAAHGVGV